MAREGLHSNRHQANSGPSGLNLVRWVFGAGAVATRRWTPPPSAAPPRLVVSAVVAVAMARRKHLARGGGHVRKSDVSLSNAILARRDRQGDRGSSATVEGSR